MGFKAIEVGMQTAATKAWLREAGELEIPVGLSSFGPTVFCVHRPSSQEIQTADSLAEDHGLARIGTYTFTRSPVQVSGINAYEQDLQAMLDGYTQSQLEERVFRERPTAADRAAGRRSRTRR